ncbi:hypothetical protein NC651_020408 [Populus alba x Populus x berolinensis]|nr:hypothetical protein NC651_020408 [Populus alba x Populus x berolinensis]
MDLIFTLCVCGVGHIYIAQLECCSLFMRWSEKQGRGIFSGERLIPIVYLPNLSSSNSRQRNNDARIDRW